MKIEILSYRTTVGRDPVQDFIAGLPMETREEVITLLRRLESGETLSMPSSRSLASLAKGLYELRLRDEMGQIRIFYYRKIRNIIYLVHALRKKSQTIPQHEGRLIIRRLREIDQLTKGTG